MRWALTYLLFPIVFGGAMTVAFVAAVQGWRVEPTVAAITVACAVIIAWAERRHTLFSNWRPTQRDVRTDLAHTAVSMVVVPKAVELGLRVLLLGFAAELARRFGMGVWPHQAHVGLQFLLALLISQFGEYWFHRLSHQTPWLWRLHATHHSPHRLYWLNAARFHPLDTALNYTVSIGPLILLGAGADMLMLLAVFMTVHGMFQHCNVDLRLGPLNYVFSMAELHRYHHSLDPKEANANYGNNILLFDLVFGTVHYPKDETASESIGLSDLDEFPQDYAGQILSPFRWPSA